MQRKVRVSSLVLGAVFCGVAINALLGGFDDGESNALIVPVMAIAIGIAAIGGAISNIRR